LIINDTTADQADFALATSRQRTHAIPQLRAKVGADQAAVDSAGLQMAYSEIRPPIAGVAGLRLTDPG
jgi:multidrug efflux pump subunit AcrA (membrane-fusion protein)